MSLDGRDLIPLHRAPNGHPNDSAWSWPPDPSLLSGGGSGAPELDESDLRTHLLVVRRRWKVVVAVALVAVLAALGLALRQEATYQVDAEVLIRQRDPASLLRSNAAGNANDAARALNNEVKLFESGTVVAAVEAAYDGPLAAAGVRATVSSDASDVLEVSLTASDPVEAAELLNLYVDVFVDVRRAQRTDELLAVGTEIQAKIDELTAELVELRQPLTDLERRLESDPGDPTLLAQRADLEDTLAAQLSALEGQQAFYQSQIEDLELTAGIAQTGGAQVLSAAVVPDHPVGPTPTRDAALALVLGLTLGLGIAFLLDSLDERIRSPKDLEQVTGGLPTLALIPEADDKGDVQHIATRDDPRGVQAEAFRALRTAVKFAALDRPVRVLQVTSASQGEGKTTTVVNLAMALAQGGDRVAVVCCDLRRPRLQERFGEVLTPGLTDVLLGDRVLSDALRRNEPNVLVLPAGTPPPNPSELLASNKAAAVIRALSEEFDVVLIDSTPVLPVTDALVVSRLVDATIVVADSRSTARKALQRTLQLLGQVSAPVLGVVLNGIPEGAEGSYGYRYEADKPTARRRTASTR